MKRRVFLLLLSALFLSSLWGCGEEETRETRVSRTLDNGLTIVAVENAASDVVTIQAWVADGALYEDADEAGEAFLLAHSIFQETASYADGEILETIESLGGMMSTYSSHDFALFSMVVGSPHFERALDMMCEGLLDPVFDDARLARLRTNLPTSSSLRPGGPIDEAYRLCSERMLSGHPYGRQPEGTAASVASVTVEDLGDRHRALYVPNNLVIVVVGALDAAGAADAVAARFTSLDAGEKSEPASGPPEWPDGPQRVVREADVRRTFAAIAFPGPGIEDPGSVAMDVLTGVLWRGASSGLHHLLVEELGVASSVSVGWYTRRQPSPVFIWLELEPGSLETAENAILGAATRLAADGAGEEEVAEVVRSIRASVLFGRETSEGQAHNIGYWTSIGRLGFEREYLEDLGSVTPEDVRRLAEQHLRARSRVVAAIVPSDTDGRD
jgi:zinc protease